MALSTPSNRRGFSVSASTRPRALQVLQTIGAEAQGRGYEFLPRTEERLGFQISVGVDRFDFALGEEQDKADVYPEEEIAAAKYSWQRVRRTPSLVPSG